MKLTFKDRLTVLYAGVIPQFSNVAGVRLEKAIRAKVEFSADEAARLGLKNTRDSFTYASQEPLENFAKEVEFTPQELSLLIDGATRLDANNACTLDTVDTVEKFINLKEG